MPQEPKAKKTQGFQQMDRIVHNLINVLVFVTALAHATSYAEKGNEILLCFVLHMRRLSN